MLDDTPFVSVVLPCYNCRRTLGDCLSALEAQSYPRDRFEVIVADNGSTDGSREFIRSNYPRVRIVEATTKGSGYARNAGIFAATGDLILSTDSDCVADPYWIANLVQAYQTSQPNTAAIGGLIVPYAEETTVEKFRPAWISQPDIDAPETKVRYAATPNAAFRATALKEIGGFDGTLGFDDTDLGLRLQAAGYSILHTKTAVIRHRNPREIRELYRHRLKYGEFAFTLARKHPAIFGDPRSKGKQAHLLLETVWRILKDILKLPLSFVFQSAGKPAGWPILDAIIAWGNYKGFIRASKAAARSSVKS